MLFTHDTEIALQSAAALVNTMGPPDTLTTDEQLETFVRDQGWSGELTGERVELDEVRALRPQLARLWELDEDALVPLVNGLLTDARALPQLVDHDDWGWHLHAVPDDAPLATRMAVEAAMAMVDALLGQPEGTARGWGALERSAAQETANIVACAFIGALDEAIGLGARTRPGPPEFR